MLTTDGLADDVRGLFGPHEGCGVLIPGLDVGEDMPDQRTNGVEGSAADRFLGEDAEPRLDQVDPRRALGGEVEVDRGMSLQPFAHGRSGVRRRVVDDDVQLLLGVTTFHTVEEANEVKTGVALAALTDHVAGGYFPRSARPARAAADT